MATKEFPKVSAMQEVNAPPPLESKRFSKKSKKEKNGKRRSMDKSHRGRDEVKRKEFVI